MIRSILTLCAAIMIAIAAGCSTSPATNKTYLDLIGAEQELALGEKAQPEFLKEFGGDIPSEPIRRYVSDIGQKLAAVSESPNLPWEFHVVDSSVINAFALPGGKIFMSRGLLAKFDNEAQLAGVLGHEIGHVTDNHIRQQMSQQMVWQGIGAGLTVAGESTDREYLKVLGIGTQVGSTVYLLKFSRDQESTADRLGVRYMTRAGYNPYGQLQVMRVLKEAAGESAGGLEILSTHPLPDTRINRLEELLKKSYPEASEASEAGFYPDRFRSEVLARLAKLPPARHTGEQPAAKALRSR